MRTWTLIPLIDWTSLCPSLRVKSFPDSNRWPSNVLVFMVTFQGPPSFGLGVSFMCHRRMLDCEDLEIWRNFDTSRNDFFCRRKVIASWAVCFGSDFILGVKCIHEVAGRWWRKIQWGDDEYGEEGGTHSSRIPLERSTPVAIIPENLWSKCQILDLSPWESRVKNIKTCGPLCRAP